MEKKDPRELPTSVQTAFSETDARNLRVLFLWFVGPLDDKRTDYFKSFLHQGICVSDINTDASFDCKCTAYDAFFIMCGNGGNFKKAYQQTQKLSKDKKVPVFFVRTSLDSAIRTNSSYEGLEEIRRDTLQSLDHYHCEPMMVYFINSLSNGSYDFQQLVIICNALYALRQHALHDIYKEFISKTIDGKKSKRTSGFKKAVELAKTFATSAGVSRDNLSCHYYKRLDSKRREYVYDFGVDDESLLHIVRLFNKDIRHIENLARYSVHQTVANDNYNEQLVQLPEIRDRFVGAAVQHTHLNKVLDTTATCTLNLWLWLLSTLFE